MISKSRLFQSLSNRVFARLYWAQTINLIGDSLTWVGLALLAFDLAGKNSGVVLSVALTLRVSAFVLLSPLAGAIADNFDRKRIMVVTHLARMLLVSCLPFVTQIWQIYALVLALNVFSAFFTPTYKATIPLVTGKDVYSQAIALSGATYQLLGVLGPGLAGGVAAFIGARQVFFLDGLTFLIAAILIFALPGKLIVNQSQQAIRTVGKTWQDIRIGTTSLFMDPAIRYALFVQLITAIAGAQILVNTVGYVQGTLKLGNVEYGWVMTAFGIGATIASVTFGSLSQRLEWTTLVRVGAMAIAFALLPANFVNLPCLLLLWSIAGAGQSLVDLPTQTLIADRIPIEAQGKVYGAHFAWSHLWWAFAYPLAGLLGSHLTKYNFFWCAAIAIILSIVLETVLKPKNLTTGFWHEHEHIHDEYHQHVRVSEGALEQSHSHLHFHSTPHF
jgi:MFS transporter, NRE family, putaive nickel resistance protein